MAVSIVDRFTIASGKRLISLEHWPQLQKKWQILVYIQKPNAKPMLLSTSEYFDEDNARKDFETRRPKMRDATNEEFDMPMQKGKRLIQEVMTEKLGQK